MKKTSLRQNIQNTDRKWYIIDAQGKTLGRISTHIARILSGRHRADFTPHTDGGDYVIITNIEKVSVSGNKEKQKMYYRHSGYLGHLKSMALSAVREKQPERILKESISGMLPKSKLRQGMMARLILVQGADHLHMAQKPIPLTID